MKKLIPILVLLLLLGGMQMHAAEENTVRIGKGDSLVDAVSSLEKSGGTVVLTADVTVSKASTLPEVNGDLTITADGGSLVLTADLTLTKNTNANTVTFDCPITASGERNLFGGFNSVTFSEDVTVDGALHFYGGVDCGTNPTLGVGDAAVEEKNRAAITTLPYDITVNGGTFATFLGGNRRNAANCVIGSIAAPITVTVNGGTFGKAVSYGANDPLKLEQTFSLSGMSILADDATLTVNGGVFLAPIYAQGHLGEVCTNASGGSQITKSDRKYYAIDGDITLNLLGGTYDGCEINAHQNAAGYTQLLRGDYTVNIGEDAVLTDGIIIDATQVKGYADSTKKATLSFPTGKAVTYKRFDLVNGTAETYSEPLRIACIGDSITEGYSSGNRQTLSYPAQLLKRLHGEGKDVLLGNYGCSGTRVLQYNKQYYNDMLAYTLSTEEADADLVIIGLGTNDAGITQSGHGQLMRFYEEYMQLLRDYGENPETEKVYATTATYRPSTYGYGAVYARAYQIKAVETLAKTADKYVSVDLYALLLQDCLDDKVLKDDNLHPHADGYTIYVDKLYNAIYNGKCTLDGFLSEDIYLSANGTLNIRATEDEPTNSLLIAFAKAAPTATLHIIGEYNAELIDYNRALTTPPIEHFTIRGEGEGAKLILNSKFFLAQSDIVLDNLTITTSASGALLFQLGYHNATLTESFHPDSTGHNALLAAGYMSFSPDKTATFYNSREAISSDRDCTINVNGGRYAYILGGNYLYNTASILGTYSGNMQFNIGKDVTFTVASNNKEFQLNGACGQNYLTGNIHMQVNAWPEGAWIRDYSLLGTNGEAKIHDPRANTGTVTITRGEDVANPLRIMGDFNGDETVNVADALLLLHDIVNTSFTASTNYYGRETVFLSDVLFILKQAIR